MLVPLRENAVDRIKADWSSSSQILVGNGPFFVRTYSPGEKLVLRRNRYYYRNIEEDSIKKSVTPTVLSSTTKRPQENLADFESGDLVYLSNRAFQREPITVARHRFFRFHVGAFLHIQYKNRAV